jgi:signal peptidase I
MSEKKEQTANQTNKNWWIENVLPLVVAIFLILAIRSSVVEPFKIPSGSMLPTLFIGDHIFVNKFAYGIKIPFSDFFLGRPIHLLKRDPPQRGDIIVFLYPRDESIHYIKRVIGVPGDVLEIRNKQIFINGEAISRQLLPQEEQTAILEALGDQVYDETNLEIYYEEYEKRSPTIMIDSGSFSSPTGPIRVPDGQYFTMGDNRDFSADSRIWGYVPERNIKGRAFLVWLSIKLHWDEKRIEFHPSRSGTILQ